MNKIANRFRRWLTLAVLGLLCWSTTPLTGQAVEVRYNVVKIIEGTGTSVPEAGGINQKGVVVGSMDTFGGSGFWLWSNGVRHDLPLGTNRNCYVKGLNNQGQVVGSFHTGQYGVDSHGIVYPIDHAFVQTAGSLQDLGTLGGEVSIALWINDQGVVLGAADATGVGRIPFIARDGQMRSLQSLISNPGGWKLALETHYVAADGRIWGLATYGSKEHIYEMTPETNGMYRIRSRAGLEAIDAKLFAFNEHAEAVGIVTISADRGGAFLWDGKTIVLLGDLGWPGSYAYAINNFGQVVGMSLNASQSYNAFLWEDGAMFNLNNLIPPESGVVLTRATAGSINDAGQIVCTYRNLASGLYGVCLLVPVNPVPLQISHYERTQDGLSLEVAGGAGQPLAVEYTSDWTQWTTLATSTNPIGRRMFMDPDVGSATFRAYRARLLAP